MPDLPSRPPLSAPLPHVLLVDDDEALAELLASHLQVAGFSVTSVGSVAQATSHLGASRGEGCAVLVTDQLLPDGRGSDLLRAARAAGVEAPAVFMSAFLPAPALRAELTERLGVARIVRKPVTPGQLVRLVREVVAGRAAPTTSRQPAPERRPAGGHVDSALSSPASASPARPEPRVNAAAAALEQRLAALRRDYAIAARTQAQDLHDKWASNEADVHPVALVREVRAAAHKLHGTGGSYGLDALSAAAAEVEALTERILALHGYAAEGDGDGDGDRDGDGEVPSELLVRVGAELARLLSAAEEAAGERAPAEEEPPARREPSAGSGVEWSVLMAVGGARASLAAEGAWREAALTAHARAEVVRDVGRLEEAAARGPFDAVVWEHGFGGQALAQAAEALRAAFSGEPPPLVVVGPASVDARIAAARAGADVYLVAPLGGRALGETLQRVAPRPVSAVRPARAARPRFVVLALDDDVAFLAVLAAMAETAGVRVEPLLDARAVFEALERLRPAMLLCDLHMPGLGGAEVCRLIRASPDWAHLPVHILTASKDPGDRAGALAAGADSVLNKPLAPAELQALLDGRARVERELQARAERDTLTGLSLRAPFLDKILADLPVLAERGAAGSLVLLDVAQLGRVDEEHGPLASDEVLRHVGRVLGARCRAEDATCRWAGDRFAVWLPLARAAAARGVAARIVEAVSSARFRGGGREGFQVSLHVGVATFPEVRPGPAELLAAAARDLDAGREASGAPSSPRP